MNRFGPLIVIVGAVCALAGCGGSSGSGPVGPGVVGPGAVDSAAVGPGAVDSAAVGPGAVGSAADRPGAVGPDAVGLAAGSQTAGSQTVGQPVGSPIATVLTDPAYTVTAQGVGEVSGTPDTLVAIIGVQTSAAKAKSALDDNNRKAGALIAALKANGVAAKDLQTTGLSLQPRYGTKENQITGYDAFENVTATVRGLRSAGSIIDAAVSSVGDSARVQQLNFSFGDETSLRAAARSDAVIRAHAQAAQMAKAAGAALGRVRSITELPLQFQGVPAAYGAASSSSADAAGAAVPLEPGTQQLSVAVTVTYDLA